MTCLEKEHNQRDYTEQKPSLENFAPENFM